MAAMTEVGRLVRASMVRIGIEDPATPDARWCFERYIAELNARFETGFDPAPSIPADVQEPTRPAGMLCGSPRLQGGSAWGEGPSVSWSDALGKRKATVIRHETNHEQSEAIVLYPRSRYVEVDSFDEELHPHHWFEKHLVFVDPTKRLRYEPE